MSARRLWRLALVVALGLGLPMSAAAQDVVEYYGTDAIGSVRIVFDATGNIVGRMDYGPFGEQLSASTVGQKSYAGLFRDGEAGLDYAEARSYQVRTGRFNAPDPVYAGLFEPQAWNRYSYALNNPMALTDTSGLDPEAPQQDVTCKEGKDVTCTTSSSVTATAARADPRDYESLWERFGDWWQDTFGKVYEIDLSHLDVPSMIINAGNAPGELILEEVKNTVDEVMNCSATRTPTGCANLVAGVVPVGRGLKLTGRLGLNGFAAGKLSQHFKKHAAEWGAGNITEAAYLKRAQQLLSRATGGNILSHTRPNGDVLRYNSRTNEFAVGASDGTIRTLFRPVEGVAYWLREIIK